MKASLVAGARRRIVRFLAGVTKKRMRWLECVDPSFAWILRRLYGADPQSIESLAEAAGLHRMVIASRRAQALYLLGYRCRMRAQDRCAARYEREAFELRSRLAYRLQSGTLSAGDRTLAQDALALGPMPHELSLRSAWSYKEAKHGISRLAGSAPLQLIQPGEQVRRITIASLLREGDNPKARFELFTLELLVEHESIRAAADASGVPGTVLSIIAAEIRTELAGSRWTRCGFAKLLRDADRDGRRGVFAVNWINSRLSELHAKLRSRYPVFTPRERRYLVARRDGRSVKDAAKSQLCAGYVYGSIIDRAYLGTLCVETVEFPKKLPLPPLTNAQAEFLKRL